MRKNEPIWKKLCGGKSGKKEKMTSGERGKKSAPRKKRNIFGRREKLRRGAKKFCEKKN